MPSRTAARRLAALVAAAALAPLLGGCGGGGPPANQSQQMTAEDRAQFTPRDKFEAGREVPISAETHCAAGRFADAQGKLPQAIEQYQKALKLNPKHQESLYRLAVAQVKQKNLPAAIETWNRYVAATGGDATAYANLGFAFELAGRPNDAEAAYQRGVKRDPTNAACRTNYGLMLARRERFNEAVLQLQTVMPRADVHYNMASVYEDLGRPGQAKVEYRKALELDPEMRDAATRLAALE